jgi:hypothetical protein
MVAPVKRIEGRRYEAVLPLKDYFTLDTFGPHQTHKPGELLTFNNWDVFAGYVRGRAGSEALNGTSNKLANRQLLFGVVWDTGATEYALVQIKDVAGTGCEFWTVALAAASAFTQVSGLTLATIEQADMHISGDRCLVFTPIGNRVIEYAAGVFTGRALGMPQPFIASVTNSGAGALTGKYTYGVELLYIVNGVDRLGSTPSRQVVSTRVINSITMASGKGRVAMDSAVPAANTLWTHARLFRSKSQNIDYSDTANPVDAQGLPEELYSLQTMTRADFVAAAYTFADDETTDANIPATAIFLELDRIDLEPLPAAYIGLQHRGRIFVSRMQGVNDTTQANIGYSSFAGTKYSEQWDPDQIILAEPGDGQQTMKLLSIERDLIVIKEAKTGRVMDGDPDNGFETLDHRIGVSHKRMASYIPGIGIAAITNDQGDFRIFTYELRWSNQWGGRDISRYIRAQTAALTPAQVSFAYVNGKLMISNGTGTVYVLHVEQGKGWTTYTYPMNSQAELLLTFAAGSRAMVLSRNTYVVEIEKAGTTTDRDTSDDTTNPITCGMTTHRFQSNGGRDVLEARYLSVIGDLTAPLVGIPYGNGLPWPDGVTAVSTNFILDPALEELQTALRQREYRLYLEDKLICNYLHYVLTTQAPCTIHDMQLAALVMELPMGAPSFDPYGVAQFAATFPTWASDILLYLPLDADSATGVDHSGRARDHEFGAAGSRAFNADIEPGGGQVLTGAAGSGYVDADWEAVDYIGDTDAGLNSSDYTFEYVVSFPSLAAAQVIHEGGNAGTRFWRLLVNTDGSLQFDLRIPGAQYRFTTAAAVIAAGTDPYTIQFVLSNGGLNGQFYAALSADDTESLTTTRSALP